MGKDARDSGVREIWAVVLVGLALLLFLSLISYHPYDVGNASATGTHRFENFVGPLGAWISYICFNACGLAAYFVMVVLGVVGVGLLMGRDVRWGGRLAAGLLLLVSASCLLHVAGLKKLVRSFNLPDSAGGFVGLFVGGFFQQLVGTVGTVIIFVVLYLISLILLINFRPSYWVALAVTTAQDVFCSRRRHSAKSLADELTAQQREITFRTFELERELERKKREAEKLARQQEKTAPPAPAPVAPPNVVDKTGPLSQPKPMPQPAAEDKPAAVAASVAKPAKKPATPTVGTAAALPAKPSATQPAESAAAAEPNPSGPYELPPLDLLNAPPSGLRAPNVVEDLKLNAETLRATLEEFGIEVQVTDVTKGPTVTLYELVPAPGVKVEKIAALSNNIALAMRAVTVRILTPVPGKGTVGVEVPNPKSATVYLRDLLECEQWRNAKGQLPIALGRDVAGNPIIADLADMPHLLVAGATGSGKTVCVNAILATLLCRFTPDELRLVLIDPKVVEMQHFSTLPHLVVPVVTEAKKVPIALRWVINEMERRYQIFAKVGVRNIVAFNSRPQPKRPDAASPSDSAGKAGQSTVAESQGQLPIAVPREDELVIPDKLPHIVVVVDELADLMLTVPADVEMAVARLTALGRAAGIHLIIATQRPSVDVVTGVIKANIPARIAFQVASKQDSRVILDANGADKLLGKGDMLYLPPGSAKPIRAQGVLVTDEEIRRIVDFISARSKPRFVSDITQKLQRKTASNAEDEPSEEDEELVEQAIEVIRQTNRASVSILQRRLRIGYTRAARIMDLLEERGIVGPGKGAEPRDILIDLDARTEPVQTQ